MTLLSCHEKKTFHFLSDKTYYRSEKKNNKNHRKSREKEKDKKNKMCKKKNQKKAGILNNDQTQTIHTVKIFTKIIK